MKIERLVLTGLGPVEAKALSEGLQLHLRQVLQERTNRQQLVRWQRMPVLRLGRMQLGAGPAAAGEFGGRLARAIGRKLEP